MTRPLSQETSAAPKATHVTLRTPAVHALRSVPRCPSLALAFFSLDERPSVLQRLT